MGNQSSKNQSEILCPFTREKRDKCIFIKGVNECKQEEQEHIQCMEKLGYHLKE